MRAPRASRRGARQAGIAMPAAIMTVMLVSMILVVTINVTLLDVAASRRSVDVSEGRVVGETVVDDFYATLVGEPAYIDELLEGRAGHEAFGVDSGGEDRWAALDDGIAVECPDITDTCFHLDVRKDTEPGVGQRDIEIAVVEVTLRSQCRSDGSGCVETRLQQRLRRREFFHYLHLTDLETLDPGIYPPPSVFRSIPAGFDPADCAVPKDTPGRHGACLDPSYHGQSAAGDDIDGPVHTNDTYVLTCGRVRFRAVVEATGSPVTLEDPAAGCTGGASFDEGTETVDALLLPGDPLDTHLPDVAPASHTFTGDTDITLSGRRLRIDQGAGVFDRSFPDTGVVFVAGDVTLRGTVDGALTIAGTGDVTIDDHVRYAAGESTADDTLGVIAGGSVVLVNRDTDLVVHGALLALGGSVHVDTWWDDAGEGDPTLTIFGAIAARFRGAYGSVDQFRGTLEAGYHKDFRFDQRLDRRQPPFFLKPVASGWQRLDITEVVTSDSGVDDA